MTAATRNLASIVERIQCNAETNGIHHPLRRAVCDQAIRMLRLPQVLDVTGLCKSEIYKLQAAGEFPMRVRLTARSVGWIESEVQAWLECRVNHDP